MSVSAVYLNGIRFKHIHQCRQVSLEIEIILIIAEVQCDINGLVSEYLLEKKLLICDLNAFVNAVAYRGISAVYPAELHDMVIQLDILALHILKMQAGTEIVVRVIFFSALYAVFTSVIYRRDAGHRIHKSID